MSIIMKYPFNEDLNNKVDSGITFGYINGSIDTIEKCYRGGVIATHGDFDLSQKWIISFDYKYLSGYADWENIFAFGTWYGYGGDSWILALSLRGNQSWVQAMNTLTDVSLWHNYTLRYDNTKLYFYIDNQLKSETEMVLTKCNGLYFNGAGCTGQISGCVKNLKFDLGSDGFDKFLYLSKNNIIYGVTT